jgi:hypothetical protein
MSASTAGCAAGVELEELEDGGDGAAFLAEQSHRSHDASDAAPVEPGVQERSSAAGRRAARWRLVAAWSCFCWGVRMGNFVIPLLLVDAFPKDLAPAAAYVIITDLAVLFFNPYIGRAIDAGERRSTLKRAIVLDFVAILGVIASLCVDGHSFSNECNILRRYFITLSKDGYFGASSAPALWAAVLLFVACAAAGAVHTVMAKISCVDVFHLCILVTCCTGTTRIGPWWSPLPPLPAPARSTSTLRRLTSTR